jgi:hypothetical protein
VSSSQIKASLFALCAVLLTDTAYAIHRVLLVGINDYTASRLGQPMPDAPQRDWVELKGAVNDVEMLKQMLVLSYGVDPAQIVALTDQAATRAAILQSLEGLVTATRKGDVVLFYFGGHGSQVRNSQSDERDKLDESIVPADSRLGVEDIRDKVLRTYFNRILDRGARLTVILDNCHSGSGARGLATGAHARSVKRDSRDVADAVRYGQRPESRGALVLSATQDNDSAWETRDGEGKFHGVFTWAWMRAMRDASSGEPAVQTFLRAQARVRTEPPFQSPVIAGTSEAKLAPFLGDRIDRRDDRVVVGVAKVQNDSVFLEGGWANGLAVGSELRDPKSATRVAVTAMLGLAQSIARVVAGPPPQTGTLLELSAWSVPPGPPLRVSMPRIARDIKSLTNIARALNAEAIQHGVRWVVDPIASQASHVLRWSANEWELVGPDGIERVGDDDAAFAAIAKLPPSTSLFVQLPAPAIVVDSMHAESVAADEADYLLIGRYANRRLTYAWLRPLVKRSDRRRSALPLRTKWVANAPDLDKALSSLRKIHAWLTLESPPAARFPYRLQIWRERDDRLVGEGESIVGDETYELELRGTIPLPASVKPRYVYAFVIDGDGQSTLLFPPAESGSVENRFPDVPPPLDVPLEGSEFESSEPYGIDTYVLLSTDEPLPNPSILEWDSVRTATAHPASALEELLQLTASGSRAKSFVTPASWSIERVSFECVRARATKAN